jgi:hypothetical protein
MNILPNLLCSDFSFEKFNCRLAISCHPDMTIGLVAQSGLHLPIADLNSDYFVVCITPA